MMALTCACGKCDSSKVLGGAEQLEQIIKCVQEEERKGRDCLWRTRIEKRIDFYSKEQIKTNNNGNKRLLSTIIKAELEGLLK